MTLERIPLIWTSSIQFSEKVIFLSFKSSKVKIQLLWDINPILSCFFWSITWYRIWDVMSLFLYLFFIPNKRSVGITHTKYYRALFYISIVKYWIRRGDVIERILLKTIMIDFYDQREKKMIYFSLYWMNESLDEYI